MKKILLSLMLASASFVNAQALIATNYNDFTLGNITATDITGLVEGQNGLYFFASNGAAPTTTTNTNASNAQIVATGEGATQGLQLTGPNGDKGSRYVFATGFDAIWSTRTTGNDIIELEMDINPGDGTSTSRNTFGAYIFNGDGSKILAGFHVRAATRELFLVAYSTPTGNPVGNYNYSLAAAPGIQIPASVFSRIGVSYNTVTGQIRIKGPGIAAAGLTLNGSAVGEQPGEIDQVSFSGNATATPNTSATTMVMDNLLVKASATDTLLGVDEIASSSTVSVYPNPASSLVNITTANASIQNVAVIDTNGRTVKTIANADSTEAQINVADLAPGVYVLQVTSSEGNVMTKKLVKE